MDSRFINASLIDALAELEDELEKQEAHDAWETEFDEDEEFCLQRPIELAEEWDDSIDELETLDGWEEV
jgi:hypothetical protein|tara:strand:- start:369 stop:575 length:207 start_codon:yes stop_codon:yes gene_type:complete